MLWMAKPEDPSDSSAGHLCQTPLPPGGAPWRLSRAGAAWAQGEVLTVSGVLHLGGLPSSAVRGRRGRGGAVGLGLPDQHGEGVVWVHHLQRLQTEKAVTPLPVFCHMELVRGNSRTARAHASRCRHTGQRSGGP